MTPTDYPRPAAEALPAATTLLVRDGADGLEVFMVKRHQDIEFMSGALVFPGGRRAAGDTDPRVRGLSDGADDLDDLRLSVAACAIREAFEESGILLARKDGSDALLSGDEVAGLQRFRQPLDEGALGIADFLEQNGLRLAVDRLVPFAHWITPPAVPKRFDTLFFIAAAPEGQRGAHDGHEGVDSAWLTPKGAISDPERWTVVFPTRMNLLMLGQSPTLESALADSAARPIVTVTPWLEARASGNVMRIPEDAGYPHSEEPVSR
jgi:8-oxo-dGTP pyrophosphatase MutT (NUDIX family)